MSVVACPPQVVTVQAHARATVATVELWTCGRLVAGPWRAELGRAGLSAHKHEGDGATPTGTYRLGAVYGIEPDPGVHGRTIASSAATGGTRTRARRRTTRSATSRAAGRRPSAGRARRSGGSPRSTGTSSSSSTTRTPSSRAAARRSSCTSARGGRRRAASPCRRPSSCGSCAGSVRPHVRSCA